MEKHLSYLLHFFTFHPDEPFLFTTLSFWIFFTLVLIGFNLCYKNRKARNYFLFFCSLFFYYKTAGILVFLLLFSILINYLCGLTIDWSPTKKQKKFWLSIGVILNLALLSYYKYTYLIIDWINSFWLTDLESGGTDYLALLSNYLFNTHYDARSILLPVGISFFSFQAISYLVDTYRQEVKTVKNILDLGFYISFFPQLVAGPIVRASEFIPQLQKHYLVCKKEFAVSLFLILCGLVKKMVISDYISVQFVDRIFDNPTLYSSFEAWMGMYAYGLQIFCDFSGYTDIAIGVAGILGFQLPINFHSPYKAHSFTDFWKRWHISLSRWLRDYLYIPLGGNRKGKFRTYLNLLVTMILGGIWHGANIKFVVWGGLHGLLLCLEKMLKKIRIPKALGVFICFNLINFIWIFFRADSMETAFIYIRQLFQPLNFSHLIASLYYYALPFSLVLIGYILHFLPEKFQTQVKNLFCKLPWFAKIGIIWLILLLIYWCKTSEIQPFIYFQF